MSTARVCGLLGFLRVSSMWGNYYIIDIWKKWKKMMSMKKHQWWLNLRFQSPTVFGTTGKYALSAFAVTTLDLCKGPKEKFAENTGTSSKCQKAGIPPSCHCQGAPSAGPVRLCRTLEARMDESRYLVPLLGFRETINGFYVPFYLYPQGPNPFFAPTSPSSLCPSQLPAGSWSLTGYRGLWLDGGCSEKALPINQSSGFQ